MLSDEVEYNKFDNDLGSDFENNDSCTLLIRRLKSHHRETYLHSARVSLYTLLLADALDFNELQMRIIYRSAWLHDIGKLNIPRLILDHNLPSSRGELILDHCELGKQIVKQWGDEHWVDADMITYHHENLDGTGYYGRNWKQLSLLTRLIRVTDSYDKMTRPRFNAIGLTMETAFEELFRWSDIIYDLCVVERFYQIIKGSRTTVLLPFSK